MSSFNRGAMRLWSTAKLDLGREARILYASSRAEGRGPAGAVVRPRDANYQKAEGRTFPFLHRDLARGDHQPRVGAGRPGGDGGAEDVVVDVALVCGEHGGRRGRGVEERGMGGEALATGVCDGGTGGG